MATGRHKEKNTPNNKAFSFVQYFCQDSLLKLQVHVHRIRSISAVCILKFCKFRQDVFWSVGLIHVLLVVILINSRQKLKSGLWTQYVNIAFTFLLHHHSCTHIYLCVTVLFHFSLLAALVEMEEATACEYQECFVVEDRAARAITHKSY